MVKHPIRVSGSSYRGSDKTKLGKRNVLNQDASRMEAYINDLLLKQTAPIETYLWGRIAQGTGLPLKTVASLGMAIDGGSNGFTAIRKDLTYDEAMELNRGGA